MASPCFRHCCNHFPHTTLWNPHTNARSTEMLSKLPEATQPASGGVSVQPCAISGSRATEPRDPHRQTHLPVQRCASALTVQYFSINQDRHSVNVDFKV